MKLSNGVQSVAAQLRTQAEIGADGPSLQFLYETAPIGLAFLSPDCRYLQINQHLTEICGISVEDHLGRTVRECVPALADAIEGIVASILATGEPVKGVEVAGQNPGDARERSWMTYWHPVRGADGKIVGINVAARETTQHKRAEAALQASEQQFRTLADSIPQLVWMSGADGAIFWFNGQLAEFAAVPVEAISGKDWVVALGPDTGRKQWRASIGSGEPLEMELKLRGKDGQHRPFLTRIVPLRGADGAIDRWLGTHIEISDLKRREEHIRLIADELSHRSKNLLTVVMAIAQQTVGRHDADGQYARFADRLTALAKCNDLLVRDDWYGTPLHDLVAGQLKPFGEVDGRRIEAAGPPVALNPDAVQHLGLAFHELATNASKYGALSVPEGKVSIRWRLDQGKVRLDWQESGGPAVAPPKRRGFGGVVLEQIVPRALAGSGALDHAPEGVRWTFEFVA